MAITCGCVCRNEGQFPSHIQSYMQLGKRLKSFLVYLNVAHIVPDKRLTQLMNDLFGVQICKRSIENSLKEAVKKRESCVQTNHANYQTM